MTRTLAAVAAASIVAATPAGAPAASWRMAPPAVTAGPALPALPANVIDGADDRDSLLRLGPALGLSAGEIARIRAASGYVGCLSPSPSVGSGALVAERIVLTAAHILFEPSGRRRSKCFFRSQAPDPVTVDLVVDEASVRFGATKPKAGSAADYAAVRLAAPVAGAEPFALAAGLPAAGEALVVVTAHPAGMAKEVDKAVPVVQRCAVRRVAAASGAGAAPLLKTDCDATGSSSGGLNLVRAGGRLVLAGITVTTGPWRDKRFVGAPYSEKRGSVTTALGTAGAVAAAVRDLAAALPPVGPEAARPSVALPSTMAPAPASGGLRGAEALLDEPTLPGVRQPTPGARPAP